MLAYQITENFCPLPISVSSACQLISYDFRKPYHNVTVPSVFSPFNREEKTLNYCVFPLVALSGDCTFILLKYKTGLWASAQTCCPATKVARGSGEQVGGGGA